MLRDIDSDRRLLEQEREKKDKEDKKKNKEKKGKGKVKSKNKRAHSEDEEDEGSLARESSLGSLHGESPVQSHRPRSERLQAKGERKQHGRK